MLKPKPKDYCKVSAEFSDSPEASCETGLKRPAEALSPRPSRQSLAPKGLGRISNSPIRSRPGSADVLVTSVPTELLAKRHVRIKCTQPLPQTSATRRYSAGRTTDRTGTGHSRGYLPLYSPLCSPDTCTALCYLTPVPRTKRHGRSSPCPCSLENSRRAQLLGLCLVRDPRQGLGRAIPSPPRLRPGSSRILVASASIAPLAGRPIRVSIPSYAYVSHDWQGMAKRAMGRRSNHLFTIPY